MPKPTKQKNFSEGAPKRTNSPEKKKLVKGGQSIPDHVDSFDNPEKNPGRTVSIKSGSMLPVIVKNTSENVPENVPDNRKQMFRDDGTFNGELFFDLIGNDVRRKILTKLSKFPRYASDLAIDLNVSKQAVKKHLNRLLEFGIVEEVPLERFGQKIQYYQIANNLAIFSQINLTPNYFQLESLNTPETMAESITGHQQNPRMALISPITQGSPNYQELGFALKRLGQQLDQVEAKIAKIEVDRHATLVEKTTLLNQIQLLINTLVENDLEKEVIFSLFFDFKNTLEGITVMDIVNQMFLRKRRRAGVSAFKYDKPDDKMLDRGKALLELLKLLIDNFGFIRTEGKTLFFDFGSE